MLWLGFISVATNDAIKMNWSDIVPASHYQTFVCLDLFISTVNKWPILIYYTLLYSTTPLPCLQLRPSY